jgi:hypothetical protein
MPTPGLNYYKPREWLSISSLVSFARCPRKFFYGSGCRLSSVGDKPALDFGTAIHKGFPECLVGDHSTKLMRAMQAFMSCWRPELNDDKRNPIRAQAMFNDVIATHYNSIYQLLPPPNGALSIEDKVSDYEIPFAIDIGLDVPLVGRIDGWGRHRDTGEIWGVELKTSSELSARFLDSFQFNPQPLCYTLALKGLSKENVRGVMIEGLRVSKTNAETAIHPIYVQDHHLDAFIKWAQFIGGMILECEKRGEFLQYPSGCGPYSMFGSPGYQCEYMQLCQVHDWTTLKNLYVQGEDRVFELAKKATAELIQETKQ